MVEVLNRRLHLLVISFINNFWFDHFKEQYRANVDFNNIWSTLSAGIRVVKGDYSIKDVYLFYGSCLCSLCESFQEFFISELHGGRLARHFGYDKIFFIVSDRFFCP